MLTTATDLLILTHMLAREHQRADDATARAEQAERERDGLRAKIEAADERKAAELTEDNADLVRLRSERGAIVDSRAALRISVDNLTTDRDRWKAKAEAAERRLAEVSGPGVKVGAVTWTDDINNSGATMGRLRLNAIDGPRCRWDVYSDGDAIIDGAPAADIASAKAAAVAFALSLNGATLTPGPVVLPDAPAPTTAHCGAPECCGATDEEIARDLYAATAVPGSYDDIPWIEASTFNRALWIAAVAKVVRPLLARRAQTCPQCDAPEIHCAGCGTATTRAWTCYDCAAGDRGESDPERAHGIPVDDAGLMTLVGDMERDAGQTASALVRSYATVYAGRLRACIGGHGPTPLAGKAPTPTVEPAPPTTETCAGCGKSTTGGEVSMLRPVRRPWCGASRCRDRIDEAPAPLVPLTPERLAGAVERAIGAKDAMGKAYARGHADDILRHLDPVGVAPDQAEVIVLGYMREHLALLDHQRGTGDYSIAPGLPLQREAMRRALATITGGAS